MHVTRHVHPRCVTRHAELKPGITTLNQTTLYHPARRVGFTSFVISRLADFFLSHFITDFYMTEKYAETTKSVVDIQGLIRPKIIMCRNVSFSLLLSSFAIQLASKIWIKTFIMFSIKIQYSTTRTIFIAKTEKRIVKRFVFFLLSGVEYEERGMFKEWHNAFNTSCCATTFMK